METKRISELFGVAAPDTAQIEVNEPSFDTPDVDPSYVFSDDQVRRLQTWWFGRVKKSLFLTGPTGCGKTTLIEQFAARVGADVMVVPCHGKLDMAELIGSTGIAKDGSTFFQHGTGVKAMQHQRPCILLLDEMNFVPPGSIGLLNRITELKSFTIAETGEVIRPMPWLRIAATGNAVERGDDSARYRGTQAMNVALLNRFLGMRMGYLEPLQEASMLNNAVPGLHPRLIEKLVDLAREVRSGFEQGTLEVVMSTRTLIDMAQALLGRKALVAKKPVAEVNWAMEFCLTDLARPEDRDVIHRFVEDLFHGLKLTQATANEPPKPTSIPTDPEPAAAFLPGNSTLNLWIHPNRGPKGASFWGFLERNGVLYSINGSISEVSVRDGVVRNLSWINARFGEKEAKGYVRVAHSFDLDIPGIPTQEDIQNHVKPVIQTIKDDQSGQVVSIPSNWQYAMSSARAIFLV